MADAALLEEERAVHALASASGGFWLKAATLLVLLLGGIEGWYGPTVAGDVYGSDAVQYLDIAHAFERGDQHTALNPLWSQGYPALLAVVRPWFAPGVDGEWVAIHALNFAIYCLSWACFLWLVRELLRGREEKGIPFFGAVCVFVTTQLCLDQVSRVGPDQLVAALFFLTCWLLLRMLRGPRPWLMALLGLVLALGFLAKSIFLPLGCAALLIAAAALWWTGLRVRTLAPAMLLFGLIVAGYGAALSHEYGAPTLGEAGSLNYAWHVNRLAKWVQWEGGVDSADKAWPRPWIARFTQWQSDPPDFGRPVHASVMVGTAPLVYVFHAPVAATYAPYFDPPYFYEGYRHLVRWRYQVVALGKNMGDLAHVLLVQPLFWGSMVTLLLLWRPGSEAQGTIESRSVGTLAVLGVAVYLPVHLEGRYLAAFVAVLMVLALERATRNQVLSAVRTALIVAALGVSCAIGLVKYQRSAWTRALHHWSYHQIPEWRDGEALRSAGFTPGDAIGVISWAPNVQCDWAYLAGLRITSEIASPADERAFWALRPLDQNAVLLNFRQAGAVAVLTRDMPAAGATGWQQVGVTDFWIYRFDSE